MQPDNLIDKLQLKHFSLGPLVIYRSTARLFGKICHHPQTFLILAQEGKALGALGSPMQDK